MAKGGAFNVSQLIRELGLQTISGDTMRVLETIQPTMDVGNLSDITPPHVASTALFGGIQGAVGGEVFVLEVQCLAPGGLFVDYLSWASAGTNAEMSIGGTPIASGETVLPNVGQASRDPIVSIVRQGTHVDTATTGFSIASAGNMLQFAPRPIFVPRGQFWRIEANNTGLVEFGFSIREVPSSEHSPT